MQLAPHQQVELLVGTTELDIGTQGHRVITLHQRIQELVDRDRLVTGIALVEVIPFKHPRHCVLRRQANEVGRAQRIHPGGVECDFSSGRVENLEDLRFIGLGIFEDLLASQRRTRCALAAWITDQPREVTNQEDDLMPQLLELAQLINKHCMTQVQVRRRRVKASLDAQRLATLELLDQFGFDQYLFRTTLDQR
ncbi:hypothetical protein D3C80_740270 [compost metagenome]